MIPRSSLSRYEQGDRLFNPAVDKKKTKNEIAEILKQNTRTFDGSYRWAVNTIKSLSLCSRSFVQCSAVS